MFSVCPGALIYTQKSPEGKTQNINNYCNCVIGISGFFLYSFILSKAFVMSMKMRKTVEPFSFFKYKNKLIPWLLYNPHPMALPYGNSQGGMQMNVWHFIFKVVPETWTVLVQSVCVRMIKQDLRKMLKYSGGQLRHFKKKKAS